MRGASSPAATEPLVKAVAPLVIARFLAIAVTFSIPLVLARRLSLDDYGTYKQLFLISMTLATLLPFGMTQGLYFFLPRAPERRAFLFQTNVYLLGAGAIGAALVAGLLPFVARVFDNPALAGFRWLLAGYVFALLGANALESSLTAQGRTKLSAAVFAGSELSKAVAIIAPVLLGFGLEGALLGLLAVMSCRLAASWLGVVTPARGDWWNGAGLRSQLGYALPFGTAMLFSVPQSLAHQYAVSALLPAAVFAIYAVGCFQLPLVDMLYQPTGEVLMVRLGEAERVGKMPQGPELFRDAASKLLFVFVPLALFLFFIAPTFIGTLFGDKFLPAVPIFRVATLGVLLASLPMDAALRARNQTRWLFLTYFAKAALTVPLVYWGVTRLGVMGAIGAWALVELVGKALLLARLPRALGAGSVLEVLPIRRAAAALFASAVGAAALSMAQLAGLSLEPTGGFLARLGTLALAGAMFGLAYLAAQALVSRWRSEPSTRPMRIAVLMNLAPRKLGSFEAWIAAICEEATRRGHAIDVFGRAPVHPQFAEALARAGAGWSTLEALDQSTWRGVRRLSSYDVLHLNMFAPRSRMALLAYAAMPARVLFVDHTSGPAASTASRPRSERWMSGVRRLVDRLTVLRITAIAGVSDYVRERDRARFGLQGERVCTLYNGVDVERFAPVLEPPTTQPFTIAVVAYLIADKGVDHLIRALARMRMPGARLRVVGDGPEAPRLLALTRELGLERRVEWVGLSDDVPAQLRSAHVFVHPAVWAEAFGLTIVEAMAMGKPVVASQVGGIPELIEHGVSGLLTPPGHAEALAHALDALALSPSLRRALGEQARRRVVERFPLHRCVQAHVGWCEAWGRRPVGSARAALAPVKGSS